MKIYAIIVTYNAMQWIDRCLRSVLNSTIPIVPVVIDNLSTDQTCNYIQANFSTVVLFQQTSNMIEKLLKSSDGDSLLSPVHLKSMNQIDMRFRINSIEKYGYKSLLKNDSTLQQTQQSITTHEINAACWLLPTSLVNLIGGFNPLFFHYAEDSNYMQRLHYFHKKMLIITGTFAIHDRPQVYELNLSDRMVYQQLLLRLSNINYNMCKSIWEAAHYGISILHLAIKNTQYQLISSYYKAWTKALNNWTLIMNSRQQEKNLQLNWL